MKPSRRSWSVLLLCGLPVLLAWAWVQASGYRGLNGQDAHDYLHIAQALEAWSEGGARPVMAEHPHGYPIAGAVLGKALGSPLRGLRLLSMVALLGIVFAFRAVLRRAFPGSQWIDPFLLLAFAASPFLLRYSLVVMSDVPAIALLALAFLCTVRWTTNGRAMWLAGAVCAALLALSMRLAAAPVVLLLAVAWVHGASPGRTWRWRIAIGLVVIGAVAALLTVPMDDLRTAIAHSPLAEWSPLNLFRRELTSDDGVLRYAVPNSVYVLSVVVHPGFVPMGVLLMPFVRRGDLRGAHAQVALLVLVGYLLFIAGMPFQNDRVLLMAQPFAVVLLFPAFTRAVEWIGARGFRPAWAVIAMLLVQAGLFVRATMPFIHQAEVERALADRVRASGAQHVYTHGMGAAFGTLCPGVEVTELWYGTIDRFAPGALIVVKPDNLTAQWQGLPPAINWERAQAQGLERVGDHPEGWVLLRVK